MPITNKIINKEDITPTLINNLIVEINRANNITFWGKGVATSRGNTGKRVKIDSGGASTIRKAFVKTTPGAVTTVDVFLDTDTTGSEVTVTCSVLGGTELNSAIPRLIDGSLIFVSKISGTWYCLTVFQSSEVCDV